MSSKTDVVIGGGLGGLASALLLARAGRKVTLYEKSPSVGGRAATHDEAGARLNLGPHGLYARGAGRALLRELGADPAAAAPAVSGSLALDRGRLHAMPVGFTSVLTTGLFGLAERVEAARLMRGLLALDTAALSGASVQQWIEAAARRPATRRLLHALVRLTSYTNAPELASAAHSVAQIQLAFAHGVLYVHGGWQTIADTLRERAIEAGVAIHTEVKVTAVAPGRVTITAGGATATAIDAGDIVIAASPAVASALVPTSAALAEADRAAVPVRAACLDLVLSSLPRPRALFCLGIDEPIYYSVHSATANLAEPGRHTVQLARYLAPGETADASSLEAVMDRVQPGWRERVLARRFLPQLVVANDIHPIGRRRPGPVIADTPGVFAVGDWIGEGPMLVDATLASARAAVDAILAGDVRARPREHRAERLAMEAACS